MATKLRPFSIKYKTKKIKPGERVIRAENPSDAIARLKADVEGLVKIEEPKLLSPAELSRRRKKADVESMTQDTVSYNAPSKPKTAKHIKKKRNISSPIPKNIALESIDQLGIKKDLRDIIIEELKLEEN